LIALGVTDVAGETTLLDQEVCDVKIEDELEIVINGRMLINCS